MIQSGARKSDGSWMRYVKALHLTPSARLRGIYGPDGVQGHRVDFVIIIGKDYYLEEVL